MVFGKLESPIFIRAALVAGIATWTPLVLAVAATECRTVSLPDNTAALFCQGADGRWTQQAGDVVMPATAPAAAQPLGRAEAVYQGTYTIDVTILERPKREKSRRAINLNLNSILNEAVNLAAENAHKKDSPSQRYEGALTMKTTFDGAAVSIQVSGTGGFEGGTLSGLVRNGICRVSGAPNHNVIYEGPCGPAGFSGTVTSAANDREVQSGRFDTTATSYVDNSKKDIEAAELKSKCDAGVMSACVESDLK